MTSEWQEVCVGDLGRVVTGKTPKTAIAENYGGSIPFLTPSDDMSVKHVEVTAKKLTTRGLSEVKNCLLPPHSICVSCIGSDLGKVVMTTRETVTNQQINSIIPADNVDADFVYYAMLILGKKLNYISKTSTAVPIVNKSSFSSYTLSLPDLEQQRAISSVLSTLDGKIENNSKINHHLEQMAHAIFRSWFVDFEPWGGVMPEDWETASLSALCSLISRGITPKYVDQGEQIIINQKCIRDHQVVLGPSRFHEPKAPNDKWLQYGDVLVNSTGQGTLGRAAQWLESLTNVTVDSHVSIVRPSTPQYIYYLGLFVTGKEREIEAMAAGSTGQTELSRERLGSLLLPQPKSEQLEEFNKMVEPLMIQIVTNNHESERLASLRDLLLPKLMSGELLIPVD